MDQSAYPLSEDSQGVGARQRARGEVRATFAAASGRTSLARLRQSGGLRLALPRAGAIAEAVLINTGGGMAGGDAAELEFALGAGAQALVTTQSAEKIYRGDDGAAHLSTRLSLGAAARLEWLPQETILFDGARLARQLAIELASDASLLFVEALTFGRTAFGEDRIDASLRESWRVRRAGKLIFAEEMRLDGAAALLPRPALGGGARAMATLLMAAPDPPAALEALRAALASPGGEVEWGASLVGGIVVARALSPSPAHLRAAIVSALRTLRGRATPRVWC